MNKEDVIKKKIKAGRDFILKFSDEEDIPEDYMTDQELKQRRIAAEGAVMYAAFSSKDSVSNQAAQFGEGGGFDISNSQKIAAYNLLMNSKEE